MDGGLQAVRADRLLWPETAIWLAQQLPLVDSTTMQEMLTMAVPTRGCPTAEVIAMARLALGDLEPIPRFAATFFVEIADQPSLGAEAVEFAFGLLPTALANREQSPALYRSAARIEAQLAPDVAAHANAALRFAEAARSGAALEPIDLELFATTSAYSGDPALVTAAPEACARAVASAGPRSIEPPVLEALALLTSKTPRSGRSGFAAAQLLFQCRATPQEATRALQEYENHVQVEAMFTFADRLGLLSRLEEFESVAGLQSVANAVSALVLSSAGAVRRDLLDEAIEQLRFLEDLIGGGNGLSEAAQEAIAGEQWAGAPPAAEPEPLRGARIAVVGFGAASRARLAAQLRELGAGDVRQVAPSWESRLDSAVVRQATQHADLVLELVSQLGHDASDIVKNLKASGLGFDRRRISGGPGRSVREALHWAKDRDFAR